MSNGIPYILGPFHGELYVPKDGCPPDRSPIRITKPVCTGRMKGDCWGFIDHEYRMERVCATWGNLKLEGLVYVWEGAPATWPSVALGLLLAYTMNPPTGYTAKMS